MGRGNYLGLFGGTFERTRRGEGDCWAVDEG